MLNHRPQYIGTLIAVSDTGNVMIECDDGKRVEAFITNYHRGELREWLDARQRVGVEGVNIPVDVLLANATISAVEKIADYSTSAAAFDESVKVIHDQLAHESEVEQCLKIREENKRLTAEIEGMKQGVEWWKNDHRKLVQSNSDLILASIQDHNRIERLETDLGAALWLINRLTTIDRVRTRENEAAK